MDLHIGVLREKLPQGVSKEKLSTTAGNYPQIWGGYPQFGAGQSLVTVVIEAILDS